MSRDPVVADIMTTDVVTIPRVASVSAAAQLMVERGLTGLPVIEDGRLVGIVTEADIISGQMEVDPPAYGTFLDAIFRLPWDHSDEELRRVLATTVEDLMTEEVVTIDPQASIAELASLIFKRRVNPIPVVDSDGAIVGIVSRADVLQLYVRGNAAASGTSA